MSDSSSAELARDAQPILPPATIGILGGGQLGRMIGLAARRLGYRLAVLDPDPDAPAMAIADHRVLGGYDDVRAARELGGVADVVTYELEHVAAEVVDAAGQRRPPRPGIRALQVTQDRLAERRWLDSAGASTAPWRSVADVDQLHAAAAAVGFPARLKTVHGGYDGRGQIRIASPADLPAAAEMLTEGRRHILEQELDFVAEVSAVCARGVDGATATFPVAENRHDEGILDRSWIPAPAASDAVLRAARELAEHLATELGVVGTLTAEMFLMADGRLLVNELAPRVHNSGHYTEQACHTSQFEQHVRAICGLPLGSTELVAPAAMVNLLGRGPARPAHLLGLEHALADPLVRVSIYDKRRVFERRKMGHVTAVGASAEEAMERASTAAARLDWAP